MTCGAKKKIQASDFVGYPGAANQAFEGDSALVQIQECLELRKDIRTGD